VRSNRYVILRPLSSVEIFCWRHSKKSALNQDKNTNTMLAEMLEIVLIPKILGPPEIGGPGFKPFQPNGKSAPGDTFWC